MRKLMVLILLMASGVAFAQPVYFDWGPDDRWLGFGAGDGTDADFKFDYDSGTTNWEGRNQAGTLLLSLTGAGALTVTGGITMASLVVTGTSDLQGNVADSLGDFTIADDTVITGTLDVQDDLSDSIGTFTIADDVSITGTLIVAGGYGDSGALISATGNLSLNGNIVVDALSTFGGGYGSTGATISSLGALSMNGALIVDGASTLKTSTIIGDGTAADFTLTFDASNADGVITWDEDPGEFEFDSNVVMDANLIVEGTNIGIAAHTDLIVLGNAALIVNGTLQTDGSITIGDNSDNDFSITFDSDSADGILNFNEEGGLFELSHTTQVTGSIFSKRTVGGVFVGERDDAVVGDDTSWLTIQAESNDSDHVTSTIAGSLHFTADGDQTDGHPKAEFTIGLPSGTGGTSIVWEVDSAGDVIQTGAFDATGIITSTTTGGGVFYNIRDDAEVTDNNPFGAVWMFSTDTDAVTSTVAGAIRNRADGAQAAAHPKAYMEIDLPSGTGASAEVWRVDSAGLVTQTGDLDLKGGDLDNPTGSIDIEGIFDINSATAQATLTSGAPQMVFIETGVTANNTSWRYIANAEAFNFQLMNDAQSATQNIIAIQRTAQTTDSIDLTATLTDINGGAQIGDGGTNVAAFSADGFVDLVGTARATQDLVITPSLVDFPSANDPTSTVIDGKVLVLRFTDDDEAFSTIVMPHDYDDGTDFKLNIYWAPSTANAGDIAWQIDYAVWAVGDELDATGTAVVAGSIEQAQTAAGNVAELQETTQTTITGTGVESEHVLTLHFYIDHDDAQNTHDFDVDFVAMHVQYIVDGFGLDNI